MCGYIKRVKNKRYWSELYSRVSDECKEFVSYKLASKFGIYDTSH